MSLPQGVAWAPTPLQTDCRPQGTPPVLLDAAADAPDQVASLCSLPPPVGLCQPQAASFVDVGPERPIRPAA